jgi:hypothetical protein
MWAVTRQVGGAVKHLTLRDFFEAHAAIKGDS